MTSNQTTTTAKKQIAKGIKSSYNNRKTQQEKSYQNQRKTLPTRKVVFKIKNSFRGSQWKCLSLSFNNKPSLGNGALLETTAVKTDL